MSVMAPLFALLALLIAAAGLAKLRSPAPAGAALFALGLPSGPGLVRAIGAAELVLGLAALLVPGTLTAALLAAAYAGFAVVVAALARSAPGIPCGCFGAGSFTATRAHVAVDAGAAAIAAGFALDPAGGPLDWVSDPLAGVSAIAAVVCSAWLCWALFTAPPSIWGTPAR
jgi:hypothetical protein